MFTRVTCVRRIDWHTSCMNGQALHAEKLRDFRVGAKLVAAENTAGRNATGSLVNLFWHASMHANKIGRATQLHG